MRSKPILLVLGMLALAGCQTAPRRPAPPDLISAATPVGFPPSVRLVTTDLRTFTALAPDFFSGIRAAATDGSVEKSSSSWSTFRTSSIRLTRKARPSGQ